MNSRFLLMLLPLGFAFLSHGASAVDIASSKARVVAATRQVFNAVMSDYNAKAGGHIARIAGYKARISQIPDEKNQVKADYYAEKKRCFDGPAQGRVACLDAALEVYESSIKALDREYNNAFAEIDTLESLVQSAAWNAAENHDVAIRELVYENGMAFEGATTLYVMTHKQPGYHNDYISDDLTVGTEAWGLGSSMYHIYYDPRPVVIETANITPAGKKFSVSVTGLSKSGVRVAVSGEFEPLTDGGSCSSASNIYRILNPDGKIEGIPSTPITKQQRDFFEVLWGTDMSNSPGRFLERLERCAHFVSHDVRVYKQN